MNFIRSSIMIFHLLTSVNNVITVSVLNNMVGKICPVHILSNLSDTMTERQEMFSNPRNSYKDKQTNPCAGGRQHLC